MAIYGFTDFFVYLMVQIQNPSFMNLAVFALATIFFMAMTPKHCNAQIMEQDTSQIVIPGFQEYKKDRKTGKVFQLLGGLGLMTYFVLAKTHENAVLNGDLQAKPPSTIIPIAASAVMTVGFSIDMGAVGHLFRKKRTATKVSTEDYKF